MPNNNRTLNLYDVVEPDRLAVQIAGMYNEWDMARTPWLQEKEEIRQYIFATDTNFTANSALPWKNSTHLPKICQIRDNLHANYMAAMFPHDRFIQWEGDDEDSDAREKRRTIESYIANKMRLGKTTSEISKCVLDYIDYGNAFALVEFVNEQTNDPETNEIITGFVGPRIVRISPTDIVFNPTAATFEDSPKIVRSLKTLGTLRTDMSDKPEMGYYQNVWDRMMDSRRAFAGANAGDFNLEGGFQMAGIGNYIDYFKSDYVEILDFYGDLYDVETDTLLKNQLISIADRSFIIRQKTNPSWLGKSVIQHAGWRLRPDNLYAMGPLDNLIGMQYRIDHLENLKADVFDLIAHPVIKVRGDVEDFDYGPGERILTSEEGDVEFMHPDVTALNADNQIQMYEQKMEEMAGAPKQAMGLRTPGEKTAFEVQILENGANKIFLNKTSHFEEIFLEPLINNMLEIARRNMQPSEVLRVLDDSFGVTNFMKITREDITARGKIRPIGARHFARNANIIQNLTQLSNTPIGQDPAVNVHISGKQMAKVMEELLGLERFQLVRDNVRLFEQVETAQLQGAAQQQLMETMAPDNATGMVQGPQNPAGQGQAQGTPGQQPATT